MTRQVKGIDDAYAGEIKKQDSDWMQQVRVSETATDHEIQCKLQQLYSTSDSQGTKDQVQAQLISMQIVQEKTQMLLAIAESAVPIDQETKRQIKQYLMTEDPYADILQ